MIRILTPNDTLSVVLAVLSSEIKKRPESTVEQLCRQLPERLRERHPDDCRLLAHNLVDQMASTSEGRQDDDQ
jgi:hypothetical protein